MVDKTFPTSTQTSTNRNDKDGSWWKSGCL